MHQAWSDLSYIEREQEKYINLRSETVKNLDQVREKSVALEDVSRVLFFFPTIL